ncbi:retinoic acid receptor RXR-gamma-A isoform X2 [Neoarius graeffei]|uniref:retinoic acid receptor RXR-gamma-A isoform X2 n=1 Tax=Neoarius graeffei TaxID=443677 RepID=UPI00298CF3D7|nr:retinoic acid receptor RXR-gamma-A isoform X2 [Neoarius graeffei]
MDQTEYLHLSSSVQVDHSHLRPPSQAPVGSMVTHLHPSVISGIASPYSVITSTSSSLSSTTSSQPSTPNMGFNPQMNTLDASRDVKPPANISSSYQCISPGFLSKHLCSICGDRSSAVQEERQRGRDKNDNEVDSSSSLNEEMPVEKILDAELSVEPKTDTYIQTNADNSTNDPVTNICQAADKQLFTLVEWAKRIPHFSQLPLDDQVILLRAGWNELLIASFSHRSVSVKDGIVLGTGLHVHRNSAHTAGVGSIFDRVLSELVSKMKDMQMDKTELGCLRAIVLFNPDAKGLSNPSEVEALREKVYASLESYTKHKYPDQLGRFAKLLLRLPALRSIGLKCLEHLFFFKLIGDTPIDTFLMEMLEAPHQIT